MSSRVDRNYHSFRIVNVGTAICGCGMAFMCGTSASEQRMRHSLHLMELDRWNTERDEQRAAEAAEYGDPTDIYNRTDTQRTAQAANKRRRN